MEQLKQYHRQKSPPQQYWNSKYTPYLSQSSSISLMNKMSKTEDWDHPYLTPWLIENSSKRLPLKKKKKKKKKKKIKKKKKK